MRSRRAIWGALALLLTSFDGAHLMLGQTSSSPLPHGNEGVGTFATVSQFKDLHVSAGEDVLLHKTLAEGLADFDVSGGQWKVIDGVLQQSNTDAKSLTVSTGDKSWTDYVVTVKARKVTGKEGFSLGFRALDSKNFACLNGGGDVQAFMSRSVL